MAKHFHILICLSTHVVFEAHTIYHIHSSIDISVYGCIILICNYSMGINKAKYHNIFSVQGLYKVELGSNCIHTYLKSAWLHITYTSHTHNYKCKCSAVNNLRPFIPGDTGPVSRNCSLPQLLLLSFLSQSCFVTLRLYTWSKLISTPRSGQMGLFLWFCLLYSFTLCPAFFPSPSLSLIIGKQSDDLDKCTHVYTLITHSHQSRHRAPRKLPCVPFQ